VNLNLPGGLHKSHVLARYDFTTQQRFRDQRPQHPVHHPFQIPRQNNHLLPEVALSSQRIRQRAFIENLQKQIQHPRMGFFDLVEKHHAVGMRADLVR